jgi:hypothetical protein
MPITTMSKKHVATSSTYADIFSVIVWSLESMATGRYPQQRHDGQAWLPSDVARRKLSSSLHLPFRAALVEVRGDWKFYKEVFDFPAWNDKSGLCWLCTCKPDEMRDVSEQAAWRTSRCSHWQMIRRIRESGAAVSPIFGAPWVETSIFKIDWLHAVDLGIAADFAGNFLLHLVRHHMPGENMKVRCGALWQRLQAWYEAEGVQLQNLTMGMLCKRSSAPKLRASAAQARALMSWIHTLALALLDNGNEQEVAMKSAAHHLYQCYQALSHNNIFFEEILRQSSRLFALQYVALERGHEELASEAQAPLVFGAGCQRQPAQPVLDIPRRRLWGSLCSDGQKEGRYGKARPLLGRTVEQVAVATLCP